MKETIVILFWTFDLLHPGHEHLFSQAKKHWDFVIAVISRDLTVEKVKGKLPDRDELVRQKNLQTTGWVDEVLLWDLEDVYAPVREYRPDVIALGYDQEAFVEGLERLVFDELLDIKIVRLEAYKPEKYKSSILREKKNSQ